MFAGQFFVIQKPFLRKILMYVLTVPLFAKHSFKIKLDSWCLTFSFIGAIQKCVHLNVFI